MIKGLTEDLSVTLEMDVTYMGGGSIAIEVTLTRGLSTTVRVYMSSLIGKLRIRVPSPEWPDMLSVAFVEDPGLSFIVDAPITVRENEMVRGVVNKLLAGIMRKVFLETWVLPSYRNYFLPLMIPSPQASFYPYWALIILKKDELARLVAINNSKAIGSKRSGPKSRGASLWEKRAVLSKASKNSSPSTALTSGSLQTSGVSATPDAIGANAFPVSLIVEPSTDPRILDGPLISALLGLGLRKRTRAPAQNSGLITTEDFQPNNGPSNLDNNQNQEGADSMEWRTIKKKAEIVLQKRRIVAGSAVGEIARGKIHIQGDVETVFAALSDSNHLRCIDEGFQDTEPLAKIGQYVSIRRANFMLGKGQPHEVTFVEAKGPLRDLHKNANVNGSADLNASSSYVIAIRSIGGYREAPSLSDVPLNPNPLESQGPLTQLIYPDEVKEQEDQRANSAPATPTKSSAGLTDRFSRLKAKNGTIFILGFLIEPHHLDASTCTITIVSQMSSEFSRLEIDFSTCRRIKSYVESLLRGVKPGLIFSNLNAVEGGIRRRVFAHSSPSMNSTNSANTDAPEQRRIEKLRNLVSTTASYLIRRRGISPSRNGTHLAKPDLKVGGGSGRSSPDPQQLPQTNFNEDADDDINSFGKDDQALLSDDDNEQIRPEDIQIPAYLEAKLEGRGNVFKYPVAYRPEILNFQSQHELVVEFCVDNDNSIGFGCTFTREDDEIPQPESGTNNVYRLLASDSPTSLGYTVFPQTLILCPERRPFKAIIPLSAFPRGVFNFFWENSQGAKKGIKTLKYKLYIRPTSPISIPVPNHHIDRLAASIREKNAFARHLVSIAELGGHFSGHMVDFTLPRKGSCRLELPHTAVPVRKVLSSDPTADLSFLTWKIAVAGHDITFSIVFTPAEEFSAHELFSVDDANRAGSSKPTQVDGNDDTTKLSFGTTLRIPLAQEPPSEVSFATATVNEPPKKLGGRLRGKSLPITVSPKIGSGHSKVSPIIIVGPVKITAKERASTSTTGSGSMVLGGSNGNNNSNSQPQNSLLAALGGDIIFGSGGICTGWIPLFTEDDLLKSLKPELSGSDEATHRRSLFGRSGVFTFVFDNAHSMVLSKTMSARIGIGAISLSRIPEQLDAVRPDMDQDEPLSGPEVDNESDEFEEPFGFSFQTADSKSDSQLIDEATDTIERFEHMILSHEDTFLTAGQPDDDIIGTLVEEQSFLAAVPEHYQYDKLSD
ncbi:hypothetical protein HDU97_000562 [Phlyctochytrium planicorne]|nr:hypothetical protein HDU97_000562 [Phlyctochytrium planicorne]